MKIDANRLINALEIRKKSQQILSFLFGRTKRRKTIIDTLNAVIELVKQFVKEEEQKAEHLPNYKINIDLFDEEQIFDNCTVQLLHNSITDDYSIGWWENGKKVEK